MRSSTGLRTRNGITRHTLRVNLNEEDCERIMVWLPEGGDIRTQFEQVILEAKTQAEELNAKMDREEAAWNKA